MTVYTFTEARRHSAAVLDQALKEGGRPNPPAGRHNLYYQAGPARRLTARCWVYRRGADAPRNRRRQSGKTVSSRTNNSSVKSVPIIGVVWIEPFRGFGQKTPNR
jgi:hypothetical protein